MTTPKPMLRLSKWAVASTRLYMATQVILGLYFLWRSWAYQYYFQFPNGAVENAAVAYVENVSEWLFPAALIVLVVSFAINSWWLYVASFNAGVAQPSEGRIRPVWAVAWYAVPIASWFVPYESMKQTWEGTVGVQSSGDERFPRWFPVWWGSWVVLNIWDGISDLILSSPAWTDDTWLIWNTVVGVVSFLWLVPGVLFIRIIRAVSAAQDNRATVFD